MNDSTVYGNGTPTWADCATTDLDASEAFYAELFGWTARREPGSGGRVYSIQMLGDKMVAGIYELDESMRATGIPPHWSTYIEVDDVDAAVARAKTGGGKVIEAPFDEADVGRMAVIQDSVGAFVNLWHQAPGQGETLFNAPGSMIWNELITKEPESAAGFYETVLGVQSEVMDMQPPYTVLKSGDRVVAGILAMTPEMGDMPASWDVYFGTEDTDATVAKAVRAGGKALREPFDTPGGRMAVLQDPQGAVFEVINYQAPDA